MKKKLTTKIATFIMFAFFFIGVASYVHAQTTPPDLNQVASSISNQKSAVKNIAGAICVLIFIGGIVHIVIAFVNHSQNLKTIIMSYVGAFIAFAALWAIF